jgi:hypothetical protein
MIRKMLSLNTGELSVFNLGTPSTLPPPYVYITPIHTILSPTPMALLEQLQTQHLPTPSALPPQTWAFHPLKHIPPEIYYIDQKSDTSGIYATSINTHRGLPQPYTNLFHHLTKTLQLTPWPSAPYCIPLGSDQLPLNPMLRSVVLTTAQTLSTILTTGLCTPHLTDVINQNSTALRWLYYYYDMATCAKVLGKTEPSHPIASSPGIADITTLIPHE